MLDQIDTVHTEPLQGLVELPRGLAAGTAVDLGHQECFLPISVAQGFTHSCLTGTFVIVPGVIEEVDAPIYCRPDDPDRQRFIHILEAEMPTADSNRRNFFSGAAQIPIDHNIPPMFYTARET